MGIKISLIIASLFLCRMFYLRYEKQPMKHPPLKTADRALANINQHQNINLINKITVIWEILWYVPCQTHITVIVYLHIWRKTLGESLEHTAQFVAYWPRTTSLIVNIIHHPKTVHMRICIYIWLSWQNCALEFLCFAPVTFSDSVTSQLCCKAKSLVGYGWVPWITHHEPNRYLHSSLTQTHTDTHKHTCVWGTWTGKVLKVTSTGSERFPGPRQIWVCRQGFASTQRRQQMSGHGEGLWWNSTASAPWSKPCFVSAVRPGCKEDFLFFFFFF